MAQETLTKENFWNEMEQKYPKAMTHFKEWIDKYKSEHDWAILFNRHPNLEISIKYHELPIAMQFGIFIEYLYDMLGEFGLRGSINVIDIKEKSLPEAMRIGAPMSLEYIEYLIKRRDS